MRHNNLLHIENSVLLIVDVQERFRPHITAFEPMVENIVKLVSACKILKVPILITEQYPKGLGATVSEIKAVTEDIVPYVKSAFSCCESEEFSKALLQLNRKQVVVSGIEAHVCVNQTVHDLLAEGLQVHIVEDAVSSRDLQAKTVAMKKMTLSGAFPSCLEMCLFELLRDSTHPAFRQVQALAR